MQIPQYGDLRRLSESKMGLIMNVIKEMGEMTIERRITGTNK
jgi:hypothetical protein